MLDDDITRCRGEGNFGMICSRRHECARYLAIAEDEQNDIKNGQQLFRRISEWLCRQSKFAYFWPIEK